MKPLLVQAGAMPPAEIVYIPEGVHEITPTVNGKPGRVTVRVPRERGEEIAASLQRGLQQRQQQNVRPIIDFDHKASGPAAAIPKAFRYRAGTGVVLEVDWTGAGRSAVQGRDFSYFSPEFHINPDGTPAGIPSSGSIGSLVNNPAFRTIPRIAAGDHGGEGDETTVYERIAAHFAAELGEEPETPLVRSQDHRSDARSPYEKVLAHFAAELGEI